MSNYCALEDVKSELDITQDTYDDIIMLDIEAVKEFIDLYCNRSFDSTAETRYYDGAGSTLYIDDLASISGVSDGIFLDEDGDRTYEITLTATDYIMYPLNSTPKTKIVIDTVNGSYGAFAPGVRKGVKITATWGYATVPADVKKAAVIQSCRWHKRRESSYQDVVGTPELGTINVYKSLDPDVKQILRGYRKYA